MDSTEKIASALIRSEREAWREVKEFVARDYLRRGGSVPPHDDQTLAAYWIDERADASALSQEELDAIYEWYGDEYFSEVADFADEAEHARAQGASAALDFVRLELGLESASKSL
jgi:hypothetical protein